ncbi:MAG: hypothetical protein [Circoviridae sp.]|nr:MAG: hypothetical protein [Circoviridae sp.]
MRSREIPLNCGQSFLRSELGITLEMCSAGLTHFFLEYKKSDMGKQNVTQGNVVDSGVVESKAPVFLHDYEIAKLRERNYDG